MNKIAAELGCSIVTVRRLVKDNDIEYLIRSKGRSFGVMNPAVMEGSLKDAAKKTGLPKSTIWYRRKRADAIIAEMDRIDKAVSELADDGVDLDVDKKDSD